MKIISSDCIKNLNISPAECVEWVKESFALKCKAQLPAKISLHPQGNDFFNTMPCLITEPYNRFGVKEVRRVRGAVPALSSDYLLYDSLNGDLLAFMDCDWVTTMRTGAVAALAAQVFRKSDAHVYSFIGLGNTARATLLCLLESEPELMHKVLLMKYKDQGELFIRRFAGYSNVEFEVLDSVDELIYRSDVVYSCITDAEGLLCEDISLFRPGVLVVPVHTRGFQNCDCVFDKVFADDTAHVRGFRYFEQFRSYGEITDVISGKIPGRENDSERILSYNIGLGLHDLVYSNKIYEMVKDKVDDYVLPRETEKFWI